MTAVTNCHVSRAERSHKDLRNNWRGEWNKALSDFWKILRELGLKYLPVIFTVYSGFNYCLKKTSSYYYFFLDNTEDKSKL